MTATADTWREMLPRRRFRIELGLTLLALGIALYCLSRFLMFVEARSGVVLPDPLLALMAAHDVSWVTFAMIYLGIALGLVSLLPRPRQLLVTLQSYTLLVLVRIAAMYLVPLDAPAGMIPLHDPFVEYFVPGNVLTRDLFFSGHTSTLFLLHLASGGRSLRLLFMIATIVVGVCVLVQHVHYTIDVVAAPAAAYLCYQIISRHYRHGHYRTTATASRL